MLKKKSTLLLIVFLLLQFTSSFSQNKTIDTLNTDIAKLFKTHSILIAKKQFKDANLVLDKAIIIEPHSPFLYLYKARNYLTIGNEVYAIENLLKCNNLDDDIYEANYYLSIIYYNKTVAIHQKLKEKNLSDEKRELLEKQKKDLVKKTLPFAEKSFAEKPNKDSKEILKQTYSYLKMKKKLKILLALKLDTEK